MPRYTIDVPDRLQPNLAVLTARHNEQHGSELSVQDWLAVAVSDLAVSDELAQEHRRLAEQAARDVVAGLAAYKERLISGDAAPQEGAIA